MQTEGMPRAARRRPAAFRLASRPTQLIMLAGAAPERLAAATLPDLEDWTEAVALALRRERAKSVSGHWSYDLNRHIALKRARDRLRTEIASRRPGHVGDQ